MTHSVDIIQLDTRPMTSKNRRSLVFAAFNQLEVDGTLELINDHDPITLRSQFELEKPSLFSWTYLEKGPEVWRVPLTKLEAQQSVNPCCGACGG